MSRGEAEREKRERKEERGLIGKGEGRKKKRKGRKSVWPSGKRRKPRTTAVRGRREEREWKRWWVVEFEAERKGRKEGKRSRCRAKA